jgi:alpha-tubulin suppressor-like RCC1 family protein
MTYLECMWQGRRGLLAVAICATGCGDNEPVSPPPADTVQDVDQVSAGGDRTCVVERGGNLWCWGIDILSYSSGLSPRPQQVDGTWKSVSVGQYFICAIKGDESLSCWGAYTPPYSQTSYAQVGQLPGNHWATTSTGVDHWCGTQSDGTLWCWGMYDFGQLGVGPNPGTSCTSADNQYCSSPVQVAGTDWRVVSAGASHTCAIKNDGTLWCWGKNDQRQLGVDSASCSTSANGTPFCNQPVQVAGAGWSTISAGAGFTCATRTDKSLWCWGANDRGQLGFVGPATTPTQIVGSDWQDVSASDQEPLIGEGPQSFHACATTSAGDLWCWGANTYGTLGDGTTQDSSEPRLVTGSWTAVSAGDNHTCAIAADRSLRCWGSDMQYQLAHERNRLVPQQVAGSDWVSVGGSLCASKRDGTIWCWGAATAWAPAEQAGTAWSVITADYARSSDGLFALLSDPRTVGTPYFVGPSSAGVIDGTLAGEFDSCQVSADGTLTCTRSYLDNMQYDCTHLATYQCPGNRVGTTSVVGVSADGNHLCEIRTDTTLTCYGPATDKAGYFGPRWKTVRANSDATCAIDATSALWCFGPNADGLVGDGTTNDTPTLHNLPGSWSVIDDGCGIQTDGSLWCWGYGPIGDGSSVNSPDLPAPPTRVPGDGWVSVRSTGAAQCPYRAVCATKKDGTLWCWGNDDSGQLADGPPWETSPVPILY